MLSVATIVILNSFQDIILKLKIDSETILNQVQHRVRNYSRCFIMIKTGFVNKSG